VFALVAAGVVVSWSLRQSGEEARLRERQVVGFLESMADAQARAQAAAAVDVDKDGVGEFLTLQELTGMAGLRTDARGAKRGESPLEAHLDAGPREIVEKGLLHNPSGWDLLYRIYLPGVEGPVREGRPGSAFQGTVDTDAAECQWCAYAWPRGGEGHAYYVDERGEVLRTTAPSSRYSAADRVPEMEDARGAGWEPVPGEER
jgi:hypothetical protein